MSSSACSTSSAAIAFDRSRNSCNVSCGKTSKDTLHIASLVERTAEVVWGARQLGPIVDDPAEIGKKYASYYRYGRTGSFD